MKLSAYLRRIVFLRFQFLSLFLYLFCLSAFADTSKYESELIKAAIDNKLYENRYWKILLDYQPTWFGGWNSLIDYPGSFMAPDGKTNPEAELKATISSFFRPAAFLFDETKQHPKCQFIARYFWLKEQLNIDETKLPNVPCDDYYRWRENLSINRITMVFPSADVTMPASMFGHTLFRIDNSKRKEGNLLNYSVNFAANVDLENTNAFMYSILGVFGGYEGYFSTYQYHMKVQEYNEIEQRDMWEFELKFTEEEINRFMAKLWELRFTMYDYFFFKENCSYMLLNVIEAAKPELELTDKFLIWTIPIDTIRLLADEPGLIGEINYRPSRINRTKKLISNLTSEELDLFDDLKDNPDMLEFEIFKELPPERRALILDILSDYYLIKNKPELRKNWLQVLRKRSAIPVRSIPNEIHAKDELNPLHIHKTSKIGFGAGANKTDKFLQFVYRPAYQDNLDSVYGISSYNFYRIEFLKTTVRIYEESDAVLDEFKILGIGNISPMNRIKLFYTYNFDFKIASAKYDECDTCLIKQLSGDIGFTRNINILNFSLTLGGELKEKIHTDFTFRNQIYAKTGMYSFGQFWNTNIEYYYFKDIQTGENPFGIFHAGVSYRPLENTDVRLVYANSDQYSEIVLSAGIYF